MCIKTLKVATLSDALMGMAVGETAFAPEGSNARTVIRTCSDLKKRGYLYQTRTTEGRQTVTRLK